MNEEFWVYVNEPNDKAFIHISDCSFCKDGKGMQDSKLAKNGKWLGPMGRHMAVRTAKAARKKTARWCGHCARRLRIEIDI